MTIPATISPALPAFADSAAVTVAAISALTAKKTELGERLLDLEDQANGLRRDLSVLTEALKVFGVVEVELPSNVPAKVKRRRTREGFRRGELARRVLEKVREAGEPVSPTDVARAIMRDCLMDASDQKLYFAFQHKVHNVVRRQWQNGVLERVGGDDGHGARWKVAEL